jgi:Zn-dependent membrane protease YugP
MKMLLSALSVISHGKFISYINRKYDFEDFEDFEDFVDESGNVDISAYFEQFSNGASEFLEYEEKRTLAEVLEAIDQHWYILFFSTVIITLIVQFIAKTIIKVNSYKFSNKMISGSEAAKAMLTLNCVYGADVVGISGEHSDHFDPSANEVRLSDNVYLNSSVAAIGIACHEAGHAVQHAHGSTLIKVRGVISGLCDLVSMGFAVFGILGMISGLYDLLYYFMLGGIISYGISTLLKLLTIPVEIDASRRAIDAMERANILDSEEIKKAKIVLWACALTYVASLLASVMYLLRIVARSRRYR